MSRLQVIILQAGVSYARLYAGGGQDCTMWDLSLKETTAWRKAIAPFDLAQLTGEMPYSSEIEQSARIMEAVIPGKVMAHYQSGKIWPIITGEVMAHYQSKQMGEMISQSTLSLTEISQQLNVPSHHMYQWVNGGPVPDKYKINLLAILERAEAGFPLLPIPRLLIYQN